ncbi:NADAR family protein [Natronoglycomyces albus]|uniref:NADAR family protein n=1 Tax=Natronoglycomyces albus TaxID=2811108 RepID=A0A895XLL2_9ACTN|nr:NADAR family protein [Natronoglycomyces albus]QSB03845.1 NADAR family protein [Natronoglycomyces albus]
MPVSNIDTLTSQIEVGRDFEFIFFWDYLDNHGGNLVPGCLDQWWPAPIEADGQRFATAEHFMMWHKAMMFEDVGIAGQILRSTNPAQAQQLGRHVADFDESVWASVRNDVVVAGNFAKFSQHRPLRDFLMSTGESILVEASSDDTLWGIGLAIDDPRRGDVWQWTGQNRLGFALMAVRDYLRRGETVTRATVSPTTKP